MDLEKPHLEFTVKGPEGVSESQKPRFVGNGPNTVSESTVSNNELSEFFWASLSSGRELSEFLSAYSLCAKASSPSFSQNSSSLPQNSVSYVFRHSTLERVFHPFFGDTQKGV